MKQSEKSEARGDSQLIQLKPVGVVRNQSKDLSWSKSLGHLNWRERASRMKEQSQTVAELIIDDRLEGILDGIDEFSHIVVLCWAHLVPQERRSTTRVHPMGNRDFPLVGVFATHSPVRPNPILTTVVRLVEHKGNVLKVTGLDAVDGSPILDIKPYNPDHQDLKDIRIPNWMRKIHHEFSEG